MAAVGIEQLAGRVGIGGDLEATLLGIAEAARRTLRADRATLYMVDVEADCVAGVYTTETDERTRAFLERAVGHDAEQMPIWRLHLDSPDPVLAIEDTAAMAQLTPALRGRLGSGALMGVRLEHTSIRRGGAAALLGTLFCSYRHPRRFSAADRETAKGLAGLATLTLANARLQAQTAQSLAAADGLAAEQMALRRVAMMVAQTPLKPTQLFRQTAEEVAGLLGVELGLVARFADGRAIPVGLVRHTDRCRVSAGRGRGARAGRTHRPGRARRQL